MNRKRILFTVPNFITAGSRLVILDILRRLDNRLFEPLVCVLQRGGLDAEVEKLGVSILSAPFTVSMRPRRTLLFRTWKAAGDFRGLNIDIWHSWHYLDDYAEPIVARLSGARKWIYTKKNMSWGSNGWRLRSLLADRIVAINPQMVGRFFSNPLYKKKVRVINQGVDIENFKPQSTEKYGLHSRFSLSSNTIVVGCVADFVPVKDHPTLIKAIALARCHPHLVLAGRGDEENTACLKELARNLNIENRVHFLGYVPNNILPGLLAELDILAVSSRTEGFGVSLLEAMACELPCVATRCGGPEVAIEDGQDGFLVAVGDSHQLADRIDRLGGNPDLRLAMGKAARIKVVQHFNADNQALQYQQLYKELTALS